MKCLHMESAHWGPTNEMWQACKTNASSSPPPLTAETTFTLLCVNEISNSSWKIQHTWLDAAMNQTPFMTYFVTKLELKEVLTVQQTFEINLVWTLVTEEGQPDIFFRDQLSTEQTLTSVLKFLCFKLNLIHHASLLCCQSKDGR